MFGKIVLNLLLYCTVWAFEIRHWKQTSFKERVVFGFLLLCSFYLSISYIFNKQWPNINHLMNFIFLRTAESLIKNLM
jgi:hypothetical protein